MKSAATGIMLILKSKVAKNLAKESKDIHAVNRHVQQSNATNNTKRSTRIPQNNYGYCSTLHKPCRCLANMARTVQGMAQSIILNGSVGAKAEWCQKMVTERSTEQLLHSKTLTK